jgi:hypothetical protein
VTAPDESEARAAYAAAYPEVDAGRRASIVGLEPQAELFGGGAERPG